MMNLIWFDYLLIALPGIGLALWANVRVARAYGAASRVASASGLTGAEAAGEILEAGGVRGVDVVVSTGELSNHFDPGRNVLRLSRGVYEGGSLAAVGAATHEAGHAIQDAAAYPGLALRNLVVPWTGLAAQVVGIVLAAGLALGMMRLNVLALGLLYALLLIELINVPVELDASRRGRELLRATGFLGDEEDPVVTRISDAVAWTYVAAILTLGFPLCGAMDHFRSATGSSLRTGGLTD
jgi:Zn-dependent membrane protease YugP